MISYAVDRFPDVWLAHRLTAEKGGDRWKADTSLVGKGRGPIAALTDLIEQEKAAGNERG